MTAGAFILNFGYLAILVGTFLEGETILVLAGMAAHRGYLSLPLVIVAAFAGTLAGDQFYFFLGRRHADYLLGRRPAWKGKIERVRRILERYQTPLILGFRFVYGIRTVTPFVIGMSRISVWKFLVLNVFGAAVWSVAVGYIGYYFGRAAELILGNFKHYEIGMFAIVGVVGAGIWIWWLYFHRKKQG